MNLLTNKNYNSSFFPSEHTPKRLTHNETLNGFSSLLNVANISSWKSSANLGHERLTLITSLTSLNSVTLSGLTFDGGLGSSNANSGAVNKSWVHISSKISNILNSERAKIKIY